MRGSIKTSLNAIMYLLEPRKSDSASEDKPVSETNVSEMKSTVREEALRSVVPYLKQLEDYRKHKELCTLFEEDYQGIFTIFQECCCLIH